MKNFKVAKTFQNNSQLFAHAFNSKTNLTINFLSNLPFHKHRLIKLNCLASSEHQTLFSTFFFCKRIYCLFIHFCVYSHSQQAPAKLQRIGVGDLQNEFAHTKDVVTQHFFHVELKKCERKKFNFEFKFLVYFRRLLNVFLNSRFLNFNNL
jgi:hypothetical protein